MTSTGDPHTPDDRERRPGERIIDVSTREPVVVDEGERGPFLATGTERVRVFAASGGGRACAIPVVLILLAVCCACVGVWVLIDNFF